VIRSSFCSAGPVSQDAVYERKEIKFLRNGKEVCEKVIMMKCDDLQPFRELYAMKVN